MQLKDLINISLDKKADLCDIQLITNDSRLVKQGSLFLACQGDTVDGRDYITQAIQKGAVAVFYEKEACEQKGLKDKVIVWQGSVPLIAIKHLVKQQGEIAARFYQHPSRDLTTIGVTGTNGKTSITQFIAQALAPQQRCGVVGTMGFGFLPHLQKSNLTTPDAVQLQALLTQLKQQSADTLALEVSSHSLVQHRVAGVEFDIAIFTQLSRDHLDYHGDMQTYAKAKKQLFAMPGLKAGVVNYDDRVGKEIISEFSHHLDVITYSVLGNQHPDLPSIYVKEIQVLQNGFQVQICTPWGEGDFHIPLLGRFNIDNILAVIGVLGLLKLSFNTIQEVIASLKAVDGRMQKFSKAGKPTVIIDYAHTPDALEKALLALREHCQGQLYCVFGCGGDRDPGKRSQMGAIAERLSDVVIITNDNPRNENPQTIAEAILQGLSAPKQAKIILDRAAAIAYAIQLAKPTDIILVAGKGHETEQIMQDQVLPFSDSQQVLKQLECQNANDSRCA